MKNVAALCFLFVFPLTVFANVGPPSVGGTLSGEPLGWVNVSVIHESLQFDFQPLAQRQQSATIEETYEIENSGAAAEQNLTFFANVNSDHPFVLMLDDAPLAVSGVKQTDMPEEWHLDLKTGWQNGEKLPFYLNGRQASSISANFTIPNGRHTLRARYFARVGSYLGKAPQKLYQFAFVLLPRFIWKNTTDLDVKVIAPENWETVVSPDFSRQNNEFVQHFNEQTPDSITLTLADPLPQTYYLLGYLLEFLFTVALFGGAASLIWKIFSENKKGQVNAGMVFVWCLFWAAVVFVTGIAAIFLSDNIFKTISYGCDGFLWLILLFLLCAAIFAAGGFGWLIFAKTFNRRSKIKKGEI